MIQRQNSGRAGYSQVRDTTTGALSGPAEADSRYVVRRKRQYPERWQARLCRVVLDVPGRAVVR